MTPVAWVLFAALIIALLANVKSYELGAKHAERGIRDKSAQDIRKLAKRSYRYYCSLPDSYRDCNLASAEAQRAAYLGMDAAADFLESE